MFWNKSNPAEPEPMPEQREQAEKEFEDAKQELSDVQATLRQLKAEYAELPERIGIETRRFHAALEAYNKANQKIEVQ
jgi:uncharacterized protein involved in exopolysaccharide biosynthesis